MTNQGGGGSTPSLLVAFCGLLTVPAGGGGTPILIGSVARGGPAFTATPGQSQIIINDPGWYSVTLIANTLGGEEAGAIYHLTEGNAMDFADGQAPEDYATATTTRPTFLQATGSMLFSSTNKTLQLELTTSGSIDATFVSYLMANYLGPA